MSDPSEVLIHSNQSSPEGYFCFNPSLSISQPAKAPNLMADVLSYSRQGKLNREWFDLADLIESVVLGQQRLISESNVLIRQNDIRTLPTIYGDPVKLRQVFQNLLSNAVQAAREETERRPCVEIQFGIDMRENGAWLLVEMTNNGDTLDSAIKDQIFEPFFTTRAKGTGLGLAIVKQSIDRHEGVIFIEPVECGGTIVRVELPANIQSVDRNSLSSAKESLKEAVTS